VNLGIYQYENLFNHGYYTEKEYDDIKAACIMGYKSKGCQDVRKIADKKFYATNTSMLNLYAKCLYQKVDVAPGTEYVRLPHGKVPLMADNVICEDMYGISHFFNQASIQASFHVPFTKFEACSDAVGANYTMFANASYWLYPILIKTGLRIWITEGDVDNSVPITGTMTWLTRMKDEFGLPVVDQWREWWVPGLHKHEDQVAGMVWKLRGLTFASVKGAGHMMPKDKKKEALVLLDCFINNNDLPDNPN
jgi:carboxypeptidase C (cathepsin A)